MLIPFLAPERLEAVQFVKRMTSGRTQPWLIVAQAADGSERQVVMKLRGHHELSPHGLASEMLAALLARDIGIPVMPPLVISMDTAFTRTIRDEELRHVGEHSIGLNFGTAKWKSGFTIWPPRSSVSERMRHTLSEILVFDCVIENPDRRQENPNCAFLGEEVIAFDHEHALSPLSIQSGGPSDLGPLGVVQNHAFLPMFSRALGIPERLRSALLEIDEHRIEEYFLAVPHNWTSSSGFRNTMLGTLCHNIAHFDAIAAKLEDLQ